MKKFYLTILFVIFSSSLLLYSQGKTLTIGHECLDLQGIPQEWIDAAKTNLHIGYGHTSHGSQLTSGMNAIEAYFTGGKFDWSRSGGSGQLHLFEGSGYGSGYLDHDCGYEGWDDKTRTYLDENPSCNVIIWSWCGQVNNVDLETHYLQPMAKLEEDYPDVKFIYMTGHLEGQGPDGSLFKANQKIRDFCTENNKILFDFADIEKYSPDCDMNYQQYNAKDNCDYQKPGGGTGNWANEWLSANPDHLLAKISQHCSSCAHSVSLNCVKKGVGAWFLWARLAGWDGIVSSVEEDTVKADGSESYCSPNPTKGRTNLHFTCKENGRITASFYDSNGNNVLKVEQEKTSDEIIIPVNLSYSASGAYYYRITLDGKIKAKGNLRLVR